ncbi:MAG: PAS domain-containing protein, partial [Burkholderiales bacterium]
MNPQDIIELSQEAFRTVHQGRVQGANRAALSFFEACAWPQPLIGTSLEELWEAAQPEATAVAGIRFVRVRAGNRKGALLQLAQSPGSSADGEYAIRLDWATPAQAPAAEGSAPAQFSRLLDTVQNEAGRFRAAIDASGDAVVLVSPDDATVVHANDAAFAFAGLDRADTSNADANAASFACTT